jgi:DNA polymerase III subunit epsilon
VTRRLPRRPSTGSRRTPWTQAVFVALDFETTGLDLRTDEVISFGCVPVTGGRIDLARAVYREVSPAVPPSPRSVTVHHLRAQDLAKAPAMAEVADDLRASLERSYVVAWAAGIERAFLRRTFGGSVRRWRRRTIDVLRLTIAFDQLRGARPDERRTLEATARRFGIPVDEAHHALDDAFMTAELFLVLAAKLSVGRPITVRRLRRLSRRGPR